MERSLDAVMSFAAEGRTTSTSMDRWLIRMALRRRKRLWTDPDAVLENVESLRLRPAEHAPPLWLRRQAHVRTDLVAGWPVYTVTPAWPVGLGGHRATTVVYLHGGAWIHEISSIHWSTIGRLLRRSGASFVVPIYPVAPRGTAAGVIPDLLALIRSTIEACRPGKVMLLGDSAGGSLALVAAQLLRDIDPAEPTRTVLLSPALDLTFSHPEIPVIQMRDPFLAATGLRVAARLWAGDLPLDHPLVSPLSGDLSGLARIVIFSGTDDLLNPDARALVSAARTAGVDVDYHELPGGQHVYPLLPTPEGRLARSVIAEVLADPG